MEKLKSLNRSRRLSVVIVTLVVLTFTWTGIVFAPIMKWGGAGVKGTVTAVNQLLEGSGISISLTVKDNNDPKRTLWVDIDPLETLESDMSIELNLLSIPENGLKIHTPDGRSLTFYPNGDIYSN